MRPRRLQESHFGAILAPFGAILAHLGAILGSPSWRTLGPSWDNFGHFWAILDSQSDFSVCVRYLPSLKLDLVVGSSLVDGT
jgi:hypothetical protein